MELIDTQIFVPKMEKVLISTIIALSVNLVSINT